MAKSDRPSVASRIRDNEKKGMSPGRAGDAAYKSNTAKPTKAPEEANLRPAEPDTPESCGNCTHFLGDSCEIVKGTIMPDMVSDFYEPSQREEPTVTPGTGGQQTMMQTADMMGPPQF